LKLYRKAYSARNIYLVAFHCGGQYWNLMGREALQSRTLVTFFTYLVWSESCSPNLRVDLRWASDISDPEYTPR
jgi:hypothetical protein